MLWEPHDFAASCPPNDSACQNTAMLFVSFLVSHFGQSPDDSNVSSRAALRDDMMYRSHNHSLPNEFYPVHEVDLSDRIWDLGDEDEEDRLPPGRAVFPEPDPDLPPQEFDFIIVGGGAAGCVIANRLTEIRDWKVLLLEAGIEEPLAAQVPAFTPAFAGSNIDWGIRTTRMKRGCRSKPGGVCTLIFGKGMGGSTSIGYTIYLRGLKSDFDGWAEMGNEGWSYSDVLPLFKKSENNQDSQIVDSNPEYHSVGGYQSVEWWKHRDPNAEAMLEAFSELGFKTIDANANERLGALKYQSTGIGGARQSTNDAFIRPIRQKRHNLHIETQSHVTRVVIDPKTRRATGVEYVSAKDNKVRLARARKEVVISAGVANTPKLLQLSGVGNAKELHQHGIKVVYESAVGRNLHDQQGANAITFKLANKTFWTSKDLEGIEQDAYQWLGNRTGQLATTSLTSVGAYVQSPYEKIPGKPDVQFFFSGIGDALRVADAQRSSGSSLLPSNYYSAIAMTPSILAPRSRGYVKLNKTDPVFGSPRVNFKYYEAEPDLDIQLYGIRRILEMFETSTFKEHGYELQTEPAPPCNTSSFGTDDYWKCVLQEFTVTCNHQVGTSKMGPPTDPDSVVDPRLRVYGVRGLRVADASIMPVIPRAAPNAATIMIGEKASDMIKEDWRVTREL